MSSSTIVRYKAGNETDTFYVRGTPVDEMRRYVEDHLDHGDTLIQIGDGPSIVIPVENLVALYAAIDGSRSVGIVSAKISGKPSAKAKAKAKAKASAKTR